MKHALWGIPVLVIFLAVQTSAGPTQQDRLQVKRAAARIDSLIEKALKENRKTSSGIADDATFARRTYLAIAGRIPTGAELEKFLRGSSTEKGHRLVDELLASRGYESHMFNWWADLLRTRTRLARRTSGEPYMHWLKQSLARNKGYDTMVRELLSAGGPVHERGNGSTGYFMRDRNMPEDNMSNTIRLFLGSRMECAQCHNHPFDKWTQRQYFEMVAFTGGIRYAKNPRQDPRIKSLTQQAQQKWGRNGVRALRRTLEPSYIGIFGSGNGAVRLPKDYQYDDHKPNEWVTAHAIFSPDVKIENSLPDPSDLPRRVRKNPKRMKRFLRRMRPKDIDSRETFAQWLTSRDNERFATVIANRIWKKLMGRGLIEPADDIKDNTKAVAPELMEYLRGLMVELNFDVKAFQRVLLHTRFWRRKAVAPATTPGDIADLRGPVLRRMSAEQAWDSMLTLVVENLDSKLSPALSPRAEQVYKQYETMASATDEQILERTSQLVLRYTNPTKYREQQREQRNKRQQEMRRKRNKARPLYRELKLARRRGDDERVAEIIEELTKMGLTPPGARGGRALRDLARASDLPSPARDGHLLRELGQSERELIGTAHRDPTVPQILALLNAFLEQRLLTNDQALLMKSLKEARGARATVRTAFLSVLGRPPTAGERSAWGRDVARGGAKATQDLVWTLVNSHEFLFIQ